MAEPAKKTTLYLDGDLHRALRIKAAELAQSISELVSEAIRQSLLEDALDLAAFDERSKERSLAFEDVVKKLRARGKL